jgi:hypothetical protein
MGLSQSYEPRLGFDILTLVDLGCFFVLFLIYCFLFCPSILDWLRIEFYKFFFYSAFFCVGQ